MRYYVSTTTRHLIWNNIRVRFLCSGCSYFTPMRPRQNDHHFADDIFKCTFLYETIWISIKISLTTVPNGPINNIPTLVQIMAWRRSGDKPLSEPVMESLLTHKCIFIESLKLRLQFRQILWSGQWISTMSDDGLVQNRRQAIDKLLTA